MPPKAQSVNPEELWERATNLMNEKDEMLQTIKDRELQKKKDESEKKKEMAGIKKKIARDNRDAQKELKKKENELNRSRRLLDKTASQLDSLLPKKMKEEAGLQSKIQALDGKANDLQIEKDAALAEANQVKEKLKSLEMSKKLLNLGVVPNDLVNPLATPNQNLLANLRGRLAAAKKRSESLLHDRDQLLKMKNSLKNGSLSASDPSVLDSLERMRRNEPAYVDEYSDMSSVYSAKSIGDWENTVKGNIRIVFGEDAKRQMLATSTPEACDEATTICAQAALARSFDVPMDDITVHSVTEIRPGTDNVHFTVAGLTESDVAAMVPSAVFQEQFAEEFNSVAAGTDLIPDGVVMPTLNATQVGASVDRDSACTMDGSIDLDFGEDAKNEMRQAASTEECQTAVSVCAQTALARCFHVPLEDVTVMSIRESRADTDTVHFSVRAQHERAVTEVVTHSGFQAQFAEVFNSVAVEEGMIPEHLAMPLLNPGDVCASVGSNTSCTMEGDIRLAFGEDALRKMRMSVIPEEGEDATGICVKNAIARCSNVSVEDVHVHSIRQIEPGTDSVHFSVTGHSESEMKNAIKSANFPAQFAEQFNSTAAEAGMVPESVVLPWLDSGDVFASVARNDCHALEGEIDLDFGEDVKDKMHNSSSIKDCDEATRLCTKTSLARLFNVALEDVNILSLTEARPGTDSLRFTVEGQTERVVQDVVRSPTFNAKFAKEFNAVNAPNGVVMPEIKAESVRASVASNPSDHADGDVRLVVGQVAKRDLEQSSTADQRSEVSSTCAQSALARCFNVPVESVKVHSISDLRPGTDNVHFSVKGKDDNAVREVVRSPAFREQFAQEFNSVASKIQQDVVMPSIKPSDVRPSLTNNSPSTIEGDIQVAFGKYGKREMEMSATASECEQATLACAQKALARSSDVPVEDVTMHSVAEVSPGIDKLHFSVVGRPDRVLQHIASKPDFQQRFADEFNEAAVEGGDNVTMPTLHAGDVRVAVASNGPAAIMGDVRLVFGQASRNAMQNASSPEECADATRICTETALARCFSVPVEDVAVLSLTEVRPGTDSAHFSVEGLSESAMQETVRSPGFHAQFAEEFNAVAADTGMIPAGVVMPSLNAAKVRASVTSSAPDTMGGEFRVVFGEENKRALKESCTDQECEEAMRICTQSALARCFNAPVEEVKLHSITETRPGTDQVQFSVKGRSESDVQENLQSSGFQAQFAEEFNSLAGMMPENVKMPVLTDKDVRASVSSLASDTGSDVRLVFGAEAKREMQMSASADDCEEATRFCSEIAIARCFNVPTEDVNVHSTTEIRPGTDNVHFSIRGYTHAAVQDVMRSPDFHGRFAEEFNVVAGQAGMVPGNVAIHAISAEEVRASVRASMSGDAPDSGIVGGDVRLVFGEGPKREMEMTSTAQERDLSTRVCTQAALARCFKVAKDTISVHSIKEIRPGTDNAHFTIEGKSQRDVQDVVHSPGFQALFAQEFNSVAGEKGMIPEHVVMPWLDEADIRASTGSVNIAAPRLSCGSVDEDIQVNRSVPKGALTGSAHLLNGFRSSLPRLTCGSVCDEPHLPSLNALHRSEPGLRKVASYGLFGPMGSIGTPTSLGQGFLAHGASPASGGRISFPGPGVTASRRELGLHHGANGISPMPSASMDSQPLTLTPLATYTLSGGIRLKFSQPARERMLASGTLEECRSALASTSKVVIANCLNLPKHTVRVHPATMMAEGDDEVMFSIDTRSEEERMRIENAIEQPEFHANFAQLYNTMIGKIRHIHLPMLDTRTQKQFVAAPPPEDAEEWANMNVPTLGPDGRTLTNLQKQAQERKLGYDPIFGVPQQVPRFLGSFSDGQEDQQDATDRALKINLTVQPPESPLMHTPTSIDSR